MIMLRLCGLMEDRGRLALMYFYGNGRVSNDGCEKERAPPRK